MLRIVLAPARLKAVTGLEEAADLLRELGFSAKPAPVDAAELNLGEHPDNLVIRSGRGKARGFGVFITEMEGRPRSLKPLGARLLRYFHDRPVAVVGIRGSNSGWERFIVMRPQWIPGVIGAARVSKLEVDVASPTRHDASVLSSIAWSGEDREAQARVDRALDAEAVTKRFYLGLAEHHQRLIDAVKAAADADTAVLVGVKEAGGYERVALRILTQTLFCWFLQRKRLLAGDPEHLRTRFLRHRGRYFETELEPLFYETLAVPPERRAGIAGPEIPFLNGGLFVRHYGDVSLPLPDVLFDLEDGLLGFLEGWTFTVAEDVPEEAEVAVDPEMLGKVFENLISDEEEKKQGTVYTPRAVVHFMCREALVPWLRDRVGVTEEWARRLLVQDDALERHAESEGSEASLRLSEDLDHALAGLTVLDPGVGSGAFLLGMLAEVVRLRAMAYRAMKGTDPSVEDTMAWKLHAIERTLSGVDINPTAIELCRLRLWLALVVDLPEGQTPHPLPNLEHRTIVANSLTDFVNGIEVQNTREGQAGGLEATALPTQQVVDLRHAYFAANDPGQKEVIRAELERYENDLIEEIFDRARRQGDQDEESLEQLGELAGRFRSWDREFPVFAPGFHAPDVWLQGGWDITIMNPPYLGKKEVAQHIPQLQRADYRRHFGELNDLMILFARRARQLTRPGGVVSMIFNDSIFTSSDATGLRWTMFGDNDVLVCARTRCFEGKAVNGGVAVARLAKREAPSALRWIEGYKRPPADFAAASDPLGFEAEPGRKDGAGSMEVFSAPGGVYRVLPHRPLYRPSGEAIALLDRFTAVERWATIGTREGWERLSNTRALEGEIENLREQGWYDSLQQGQWVLLGYVIEGGVGLQTGDDKHFLAAILGTDAAQEHVNDQSRLEQLLEGEPRMLRKYERLRTSGLKREDALLELWRDTANDAALTKLWPKGATFRVAPRSKVRTRPLTEKERREGIEAGPFWVPFEKGDRSQPVTDEEGKVTYLGARWTRENPLVIDWSKEAVTLLRRRARGTTARRKPYFRNEDLWFSEGATWNRVASYLRCRRLPEAAIFGDKTPLIRPTVGWLSADSLMALLNAPTLDFVLRTFVGSRMMVEIGDVRRIPIPVLSGEQNKELSLLARRAVAEKQAADLGPSSRLAEVESEIDDYTREMYGVDPEANFWVVR